MVLETVCSFLKKIIQFCSYCLVGFPRLSFINNTRYFSLISGSHYWPINVCLIFQSLDCSKYQLQGPIYILTVVHVKPPHYKWDNRFNEFSPAPHWAWRLIWAGFVLSILPGQACIFFRSNLLFFQVNPSTYILIIFEIVPPGFPSSSQGWFTMSSNFFTGVILLLECLHWPPCQLLDHFARQRVTIGDQGLKILTLN